jgi:hypothetical protein
MKPAQSARAPRSGSPAGLVDRRIQRGGEACAPHIGHLVRRYVGEYEPAELKQFRTAALDEVIR